MPLSRPLARHARTLITAACLTLAALLTTTAPAHAFSLGFNDNDLAYYSGWQKNPVNEPALAAGLANGRSAGAQTWRFMVQWRLVARAAAAAPTPATLAADPNWSGYVWDDVDRMVRAITAQGMTPLPWVARAPTWAEGAERPTDLRIYPLGTWRPSAPMLEQFATAIATRYSGRFPDPARPGATLPRVRTFQAWNEPNLYLDINPQWVNTNEGWTLASPGIYRQLLNGFYRGVKKAQPTATVLAAGSAPFGDLNPGELRLPPARFYRELFCTTERRGTLTSRKSCPKLRFDGWAHHVYPIGSPTRTARNPDDVLVPDMPKLTRVMASARRAGLVSRKAAANVWITEMSWESAPDPNGLSLADHALYMQGAFSILWKSGVKHVLWWNSRDNPQGADWNLTHQSGIFARGADPTLDTRKPAFTAFRFPFAAYRSKGIARLWARPPGRGRVVVQKQNSAGAWRTVGTLKVDDGIAQGRLRVGRGTNLRAAQGDDASLAWKTF